jgi:hypothetical protein
MYVANQGGKGKVTAVFQIKSKGKTATLRRKELAKFRAELRKLAKRYRGSLKRK